MNWRYASKEEKREWFAENAGAMEHAHAVFVEAARVYSQAIVRLGATQIAGLAAPRAQEAILDTSDSLLAEEVREDLEL